MGVAAAPLLDCKSALGAARCGIVAGCARKQIGWLIKEVASSRERRFCLRQQGDVILSDSISAMLQSLPSVAKLQI